VLRVPLFLQDGLPQSLNQRLILQHFVAVSLNWIKA
jgi:hypothetical protein